MSENPIPVRTTDELLAPTDVPFRWGPGTPRGAKAVFTRIIKEGATVPLFIGQTLVNALRDLGYNDTTSAICEFIDNSVQWGAREVRVYFNESGKKGQKRIDVLVSDDGNGMAPNVLRAATAFGGSMCFDNRAGIGRYGIGMKGAALSMGQVLQIISWQEPRAFYSMDLDINAFGDDRSNVVNLPAPTFEDSLPRDVVDILTGAMAFPKNDQERLAEAPSQLTERLGQSGTIIYVPDCDRLTYRTVKALADHATKEMARVYRRHLARGLKLYVNNRRVEPFDPTYSMSNARHATIEGLTETTSRLFRKWEIPVPVEETSGAETKPVKIALFVLPFEHWSKLPRKVLKNDLRAYDALNVSFMRADREVQAGEMRALSGKHWTGDTWWRIEIEFPAELDEAFGVAVNKQGVRLKSYVIDAIRDAIHEDLRKVKNSIEEHYARLATERTSKGTTEAERRANEAEAVQGTLLPKAEATTEAEREALEGQLRAMAAVVRRADESDEEAFDRVQTSRYITTFKHDEDAPFYRADFQLGRVILTINSAHPFFTSVYQPLSKLSKLSRRENDDETGGDVEAAADMLPSLELLLLSLARTQSTMLANDTAGELRKIFDRVRRQWSLDLATQLSIK
ncbi:MAG TPA: ATP-binding protein [Thermoanaerobaculia bacterium]|nr:ATP-binding protein [Thermoanaerobaculia bacterium]